MARYSDDIEIDPHALDTEWMRQPSLFMKYSEKLADAQARQRDTKEILDVATARATELIRKSPSKYGVDKPTEAAIAAATTRHPKRKKALRVHNAARTQVDLLQAAVNTMDQKKRALENLVRLHCAGYYAEPRAEGAEQVKYDSAVSRSARRSKKNKSKKKTPNT